MKFFILAQLTDGPYGGGNQFLSALKKQLQLINCYADKVQEAEVILFNSHHHYQQVLRLKLRYPDKIFLHRIDGPVDRYRGQEPDVDKTIFRLNALVADGTIFQSQWSREANYQAGCATSQYEAVIVNAPNPDIFKPANKEKTASGKIKLVATSWSTNERKGFALYQFLDQNLDWSQYEMTFIGNCPVTFTNIKQVSAIASPELAKRLQAQNIFIFASRLEACSNSLLEALHCGLPVVAVNSSSNPELVKSAGELFNDTSDILPAIDKVAANYDWYREKIEVSKIQVITEQYLALGQRISADCQVKKYVSKRISSREARKFLVNVKLRSLKKKKVISVIVAHYQKSYHRLLLEERIRQAANLITGKALDIGSKNRRYDYLFTAQIEAIDLVPCERKDVKFGDLSRGLEYVEASFDNLLCLEVLEYLDNWPEAIKEMHRVLKPQGLALISYPLLYHEHNDRMRLTESAIRDLLTDFTEVKVNKIGNASTVIWDIIRKKILSQKVIYRYPLFLISLFGLAIIKAAQLDKKIDAYYSGLFIIAKK
jgi:glycosyltransferase involved in cell wall biosynthesis/SAM-dependent methyltransferase